MATVITILKILLGIVFIPIGIMKLSQPIVKLNETLGWINDFSTLFVRVLGSIELVIGLMMIVPLIVKSIPNSMSAYGALSIVIIMLGACVVHFNRNEFPMIISNLVILAMAGFIAFKHFYN